MVVDMNGAIEKTGHKTAGEPAPTETVWAAVILAIVALIVASYVAIMIRRKIAG